MLFISLPLFIFVVLSSTGITLGAGVFAYRAFITENKATAEMLLFVFFVRRACLVYLLFKYRFLFAAKTERTAAHKQARARKQRRGPQALRRIRQTGKILSKFF